MSNVTKEQVEAALTLADEKISKLRENREIEDEEIRAPLREVLDQYYDQSLTDNNNEPVRIGDTISDGKFDYIVEDRGMQFVLGTILWNPRVMVKKIMPDGYLKAIKQKHIHPADLKNFQKK